MSTWADDLDRYLTIRRSLGYDLEHGRTDPAPIHRLRGTGARRVHQHRALPAMAAGVRPGEPAHVGEALGYRPALCPVAPRPRPRHEVPPRALIPGRYRRAASLYLQRGRNPADRRGRCRTAVDQRHPRLDVLDLVRTHRRHRPQGQRGALARRDRCRSGERRPDTPTREIREGPAAPARRQHDDPTGRLCQGTGAASRADASTRSSSRIVASASPPAAPDTTSPPSARRIGLRPAEKFASAWARSPHP